MTFTALDVETTGTLPFTDQIVEIAAVRFVDGVVKESFVTLVNPGTSMPEEASRVNNITDDMLKNQPKIEEVLEGFSQFCGESVLVAHNAPFDFQFLSVALEKNSCFPPTGRMLDTYSLSKKVFTGLSNYKLSTVAEYLKIPSKQFHRAQQDAYVCGKVFQNILEKTKQIPIEKLAQFAGKKELRFPALKVRQLSLFGEDPQKI